jgi:hypothetical protein
VKALRFSIIVGMGLMIVSFQNCSKASFGPSEGTFSKSSSDVLVPLADDNSFTDPDIGGSNQLGDNSNQYNENNQSNEPNQQVGQDENSNQETADNEHQCSREYTRNNSGEFVACILDGPGKSIKLGIMSEKLDGVNSVAESVCVTRQACLDLVPTMFKVKGVETRGYCDHNPNVRRLSDAEVKTLLGI